jgi:hypothetical protein
VAKKLACWVGRHTWTTRVEQGESITVCAACGKTPRGGKGDIEGRAQDHYPSMYDNP